MLGLAASVVRAADLPRNVAFHRGSPNTVVIDGTTAIYGNPPARANVTRVLLTHARRDALAHLHVSHGNPAEIVAPAAERELFEKPAAFWAAFETARFHDYAQQTTKVPTRAIPVTRSVTEGDAIDAGDARIRVLATPGYTRGAVSYLIEAGGKRIACTGDLIYGDAQLYDLYSLQDGVPEAKARGYHGYAARAGDLIRSLRKIAAAKPDVLLPARGPMIEDPQASIQRLISRLQGFLRSHFESDALRWYWGDENHAIRSQVVERPLDVLAMAGQQDLPGDIMRIGNSRLIRSRTGASFLIDAGYGKLQAELQRLRKEGAIKSVDGIWITHYHDDHTDYVNEIRTEFGSPVYFTSAMAEVLEKPWAFRLPCLTTKPIPVVNAQPDGASLRWHEWQFTFWNFPGQTLYHGGLMAQRDDRQTYLFVGDSFTPSGMDDYCMQNRNFLRGGEGYQQCLRRMAALPANTWLINQHVGPMFRFSSEQIARMQSELEKRSARLKELSPWPDINYMLDESWARLHPYGTEAKTGDAVEFELRILNHAPRRLTYDVKWNLPDGWSVVDAQTSVTLDPRKQGAVRARLRPGMAGLHILTADIRFAGHHLREWTEAMVRIRLSPALQ
jgi:glyoxylase-like metal-dependent hydrolase (beta-lactamase superfamily II)